MKVPRVLIIAGSDSGGGAGIQADIKTVTMLGGHAMTAITAITAQNTLGVDAVMPVPTGMVLEQIDSVVSDIGTDVVKIGMIGSAETAHAVAVRLERLDVPIVFDPVMVASSGSLLADDETRTAFDSLLRICTLATPNKPELEALAGVAFANEQEQAEGAERVMRRSGCPTILAKGGHWKDIVAEPRNLVLDCLYALDLAGCWSEWRWDAQRIESRNDHGTGCTLASAIATGLGRGAALPEAVGQARAFVRAAMLVAPGFGSGHGPMAHWLGVNPFEVIHRKE
jgi:hydroxymethylpyrimidine/phosphomethylpyrimidine kinase